MEKKSSSGLNFVFITVLIDVTGFGIIIPVLPQLLAEMNSISINEASAYGGYLLTAFAIAQFVFSPIMGGLSDQYGRRPIILLALLGFSIDYLILAFAPNFAWLVIGRIIAGVFGASYTAASAFIADVSTPENQAKNYGLLGAAFGLGFILGPLLGGVFGSFGVRVPFYLAAGLSFLNFVYGYFFLPESLEVKNRRLFDWKRANPIGTLKQILGYKQIRLLILTLFLIGIASHAVNSNWAYFNMYLFNWSESTVGISLAFAGLLIGLVQAGLSQKLSDTIGITKSVLFGIGLYAIGMLLFAFASASWMMFVFLLPYCLGGVAGPILQSYLVSQVGADEQGELQGGLTSVQSLTTILGPLIMTGIFFNTTKEGTAFYFPGSAFLLAAILMGVGLIITYYAFRPRVYRL